jgi:hypothetical protein
LIDGLDGHARRTLDAMDREFFAYPDDLRDLLFEYARSLPHVFGTIDAA